MSEIDFAVELVRRLGMVDGGRRWGSIRKARNPSLMTILGRSTSRSIEGGLQTDNPLAYYDLLSFSAAVTGSYRLSIDLLDECLKHGRPTLGVGE